MVHILGRCYPAGVKIHYLFATLEATGLATVRKSKWHYVPIGIQMDALINLHDCKAREKSTVERNQT
jgi:hypothetical protein